MEDRIPYSTEAEEAVISCILQDPEIGKFIIGQLSSRDFFSIRNQVIFSAMESLNREQRAVNLGNVTNRLKKQMLLSTIGGAPELKRIAGLDVSPEYAEYYGNMVQERAIDRRKLTSEPPGVERRGPSNVFQIAKKYRIRPAVIYTLIKQLEATRGVEFTKRGARFVITPEERALVESELEKPKRGKKQKNQKQANA